MSFAGLSLETATRRTGGLEEGLADSMRERMEERFEERWLARAGSMRISAFSGSVWSVMISLSHSLIFLRRSVSLAILK